MTNEEEYLNSRMGKHNPFTVPDGYFERLTQQVMDKIPQTTIVGHASERAEIVGHASERADNTRKPARVAVMKRIRPWLYAAACICVGVFIAALAFNDRSDVAAPQTASQQIAANDQADYGYYSDTYIDEEADFAMIDNQEIYACLMAEY